MHIVGWMNENILCPHLHMNLPKKLNKHKIVSESNYQQVNDHKHCGGKEDQCDRHY